MLRPDQAPRQKQHKRKEGEREAADDQVCGHNKLPSKDRPRFAASLAAVDTIHRARRAGQGDNACDNAKAFAKGFADAIVKVGPACLEKFGLHSSAQL